LSDARDPQTRTASGDVPRNEHGIPGPQDQPVTAGSDATAAVDTTRASGVMGDDELPSDVVEVAARSQWQMFRRRFFGHKLAMTSLVFLILVVLAAFNAERVAPYSFDGIDVLRANTPPTFENQHYFGTDQLGRDYFSRVIYGTRTSLRVAGVVAVLSTVIGTVIGAVAGYYRGWVDSLMMRLTDLVIIVPALAILLVAASFLGQGDPNRLAVILALLLWTSLARIVRGVFLSLREKEFVQAARASGASDLRIMFRHMLPNTIGPIVVNLTLVLAAAIIIEATLSFLGIGVNPPTPALGVLINDGRSSMQTLWWLTIMPGLALVAISLSINFIGDGLRDALDPTQQDH
jgi:ABC-type dipeptide/oligopeptide/nickel transport system permease subunit